MAKKVIVIGGTGLLGYHTTLELLSKGYEVTSLALPPLPVEDLFPEGVESLFGNLNDMSDEEILAIFKGAYAVFYAAGADERVTPPAPSSYFFYEQNVVPTQRIARLAREAGVKKFVLYGSYTARFAEEWPELGYATRNGYPRTRLLQEEVACIEGAGEMDVMTLRLPFIFGTMPGRTPLWQMFIDIVRKQPEVVVVQEGSTSSVTVGHVAQAAVGAMENGSHEGRYAINMHNLSYRDFHRIICEELDRDPAQVITVPLEAVKETMEGYDAQAASAGVEHGIHLADSAVFQSRDAVTDPAETVELLGLREESVEDAIRESIRYCLAQEAKA
ncbi:NAD-dependent epimerase/dehydratase family protein [Actinomyces minihominis]|uniref:NAD-dependent epimerase/dehydratase family protein n=1 Tax=Actinomyces minihominis TaxID=2002838 RepID=UPI000C08CA93|nr:NAD-dependent epimerase/dehydratase family protein [Actinomyces minihominis]